MMMRWWGGGVFCCGGVDSSLRPSCHVGAGRKGEIIIEEVRSGYVGETVHLRPFIVFVAFLRLSGSYLWVRSVARRCRASFFFSRTCSDTNRKRYE